MIDSVSPLRCSQDTELPTYELDRVSSIGVRALSFEENPGPSDRLPRREIRSDWFCVLSCSALLTCTLCSALGVSVLGGFFVFAPLVHYIITGEWTFFPDDDSERPGVSQPVHIFNDAVVGELTLLTAILGVSLLCFTLIHFGKRTLECVIRESITELGVYRLNNGVY